MKRPFITYVAIWVQALPAAAYLASQFRTRAAAAIALGALISVLSNAVGWILADQFANNHVASYISTPATAACFLYALHEWQIEGRDQRWLRTGTILFLVSWGLLVAFVENVQGFELATAPMFSLVLLAVSIWTLTRRAYAIEVTPIQRSDWFWISLGLAVYGGATALSSAIGGILLERHRYDLFDTAWKTRAAFVILSHLIIAWGIYRGPMVSKFSTIGTNEP